MSGWERILHVVGGQHYDELMSSVFLEELEVPEPDHPLGVGSGSLASQRVADTLLGTVEREQLSGAGSLPLRGR
jgi:UDP-N-acetylglucosamine 2-epimerase